VSDLVLVGTLPIAILNPGLALTSPGISAQIGGLAALTASLATSLAAQVEFKAAGLPLLSNEIALLAELVAGLPAALTPTAIVSASVSYTADLALQLAAIEAQLLVMQQINAAFALGLNAPGIATWSYYGNAGGFGPGFPQAWGDTKPTDLVAASVLVTPNPTTWNVFGQTFFTPPTSEQGLRFQGLLNGAQLNTSVQAFASQFLAYQLELAGKASTLKYQLQVAAGLHIPDIGALLAAIEAVNPLLLLKNAITVTTNIAAAISAVASATAALEAQLSFVTGALTTIGPSLWTYNGPASGLGPAIQSTFAGGIPGTTGPAGRAFAEVLAITGLSGFSSIFRVG
jgi:hypothetical protein